MEARQAAVHEALEIRFGPEEAAKFDSFIRGITDAGRLIELHRLAIRCRRLSEFRREVEPKKLPASRK